MKKKLLLIGAISALSMLGATACNQTTDFTVGICQLVNHEALDAATQGFKEELQAQMDKAGKTITFDYQNAAGDSANCSVIANKFVSKGVNLIMANATPALQAAYSATESIPILGTSITEYGVATGKSVVDGCLGFNVSGTSDLASLSDQVDSMLTVFPESVTKIGLLYCSAEANSLYQVDEVARLLTAKGKTPTKYSFADSNDISAVCNTIKSKEEAVFVPTDNACASNAQIIHDTFIPSKIPVFAGEEGACKICGLATLSISYHQLGVVTGRMAADILLNGKDIKTMKIAYDDQPVKKFNRTVANELGIDVATLEAKGFVAI